MWCKALCRRCLRCAGDGGMPDWAGEVFFLTERVIWFIIYRTCVVRCWGRWSAERAFGKPDVASPPVVERRDSSDGWR